jgi:hypothetical protein
MSSALVLWVSFSVVKIVVHCRIAVVLVVDNHKWGIAVLCMIRELLSGIAIARFHHLHIDQLVPVSHVQVSPEGTAYRVWSAVALGADAEHVEHLEDVGVPKPNTHSVIWCRAADHPQKLRRQPPELPEGPSDSRVVPYQSCRRKRVGDVSVCHQ